MRRRIGILGVFALLVLASVGGAAACYEVRVELSTTAEWVELTVGGAEIAIDWWAPEYTRANVYTEGSLRLEQKQQIAVPLSVTFDLLVLTSEEAREISWALAHGPGGRSSLEVLAPSDDGSEATRLGQISLRELAAGEANAARAVRTAVGSLSVEARVCEFELDPNSVSYKEAEACLDVEYAVLPGVDPLLLSLDVFLPARDRSDPPPLIVCIHGGNMTGGDKDGVEMYETVHPIVGGAYAVASINYRLAPEAPFPAAVHDVRAAVRWLRANAEE